jgi:hypothetical protein
MDGSQFDNLLRALTKSRRSLLGGALVAGTGWLGVACTVFTSDCAGVSGSQGTACVPAAT